MPLPDLGAHYVLSEIIGMGGAASVHAATDKRSGGRVAIKRLRRELLQQKALVQRFYKEAKALQSIQHPHLVRIIEVGLFDSLPAIVLELLTGETLEHMLKRCGGTLPIPICRELICPVLDALEYAHQVGLVHRDLKPENIFLAKVPLLSDAFPKLLDFGVARGHLEGFEAVLTLPGETLGTPHYMAPEQAVGVGDLDERVDVYSMGVILYQLLSGKLPFDEPNYNTMIFRIATETPTPLSELVSVPPAIAAVVARAMARDPDERYPSVGMLRLEMERAFH